MNDDKTLYISDLDGTLLNKNAELSDYTRESLRALLTDGLNFSIATARTLVSAAKVLEGLAFRTPIVLMNGVLIYDTEQENYVKIHTIQPEAVSSVIRVLREFKITGFIYELKNGELMTYHESPEEEPLRDFMQERIIRYNKSFKHTDSFAQLPQDNIIYLTLLDTHERLAPVCDELASISGTDLTFYQDIYSRDLWYLELFSSGASKQNAVNYLRTNYGFERIVGFGDNLNDLPMFAACDLRVAVKNAKKEVQAAADIICGSNAEDGVAKWLTKEI